jgi:hypothetical protein
LASAELADGAVVAFIGIGGISMISIAFGAISVSRKAGHAAHPQCSTSRSV